MVKIKENQAQVKAAIAEYISYLHGGVAWAINVSGIPIKGDIKKLRKNPEMKGLADVLGLYWGLFIGIEVKLPGDTERIEQEEKRINIVDAHGIYLSVKSLDEVVAFFEANLLKGKVLKYILKNLINKLI